MSFSERHLAGDFALSQGVLLAFMPYLDRCEKTHFMSRRHPNVKSRLHFVKVTRNHRIDPPAKLILRNIKLINAVVAWKEGSSEL